MKFSFLYLVIFQFFRLCLLYESENSALKKRYRYKSVNRLEQNGRELYHYKSPERIINNNPRIYSFSREDGVDQRGNTNFLQRSENNENALYNPGYVKRTPGKTATSFEKINYVTISRNFENKQDVEDSTLNFLNIKEKVIDNDVNANTNNGLFFSSNQIEMDASKNYRKAILLGNNQDSNNSNSFTFIDSGLSTEESIKLAGKNLTNNSQTQLSTDSKLNEENPNENNILNNEQNVTSYAGISLERNDTLPRVNIDDNILAEIVDGLRKEFLMHKDFKFEKEFVEQNRVIDVIVTSHNKTEVKQKSLSNNNKIRLDLKNKTVETKKLMIENISLIKLNENKTRKEEKSRSNFEESKIILEENKDIKRKILPEERNNQKDLVKPNNINSKKIEEVISTAEKSFKNKFNNSFIHEPKSNQVENINSEMLKKINEKSKELLKKFKNTNDKSHPNIKPDSNSNPILTSSIITNLNKNSSSLNHIIKQEILTKIIDHHVHNFTIDTHALPHLVDMPTTQNFLKKGKEHDNTSITSDLIIEREVLNHTQAGFPNTQMNKISLHSEELKLANSSLNKTPSDNSDNSLSDYVERIKILSKKIQLKKQALSMDSNVINRLKKFSSNLDKANEKESNATIFPYLDLVSSDNLTLASDKVSWSDMDKNESKAEKNSQIDFKEGKDNSLPSGAGISDNHNEDFKEFNKLTKMKDSQEGIVDKKSSANSEISFQREKDDTTVVEKNSDSGKEHSSIKFNIEKVEIDDNSLISEFFKKSDT